MVKFHSELSGNANDSASNTTTCISCLEQFIGTTLSKIVNTCMTDHRSTDYRVRSVKHQLVICQIKRCFTVFTSLDIAKVTMVSHSFARATVSDSLWVPMRPS